MASDDTSPSVTEIPVAVESGADGRTQLAPALHHRLHATVLHRWDSHRTSSISRPQTAGSRSRHTHKANHGVEVSNVALDPVDKIMKRRGRPSEHRAVQHIKPQNSAAYSTAPTRTKCKNPGDSRVSANSLDLPAVEEYPQGEWNYRTQMQTH